jgi:hypothetical protein
MPSVCGPALESQGGGRTQPQGVLNYLNKETLKMRGWPRRPLLWHYLTAASRKSPGRPIRLPAAFASGSFWRGVGAGRCPKSPDSRHKKIARGCAAAYYLCLEAACSAVAGASVLFLFGLRHSLSSRPRFPPDGIAQRYEPRLVQVLYFDGRSS